MILESNKTQINANTLCFAFSNREMVLRNDGTMLSYEDLDSIKNRLCVDTIFYETGANVCVLGIAKSDEKTLSETLGENYMLKAIRLYAAEQNDELVKRIFRAKGLMEWVRNTKYCSTCGHALKYDEKMTAMYCPHCNKTIFPRIEPCIIVLVKRGNEMLLARHKQRNQDIYACLAGFMETGETAEQAVEREIMEETGIKVKNIKYFGTQSWPFPSQMMIAFTAEYESGEIKLQDDEIQHAAWFTRDNCPATPQPGSIAYQLINTK